MGDTSSDRGIIHTPSGRTVAATLDRLETVVRGLGMTVFARIDQSAAAREAGLTLRPTELLLFGDPRTGTPLMEAHPSLAMDLPLKALAWQDESDQVWLSYNSAQYLRDRHGLPPKAFQALDSWMARALTP